jgi:uncharacterized protein YdbL (DUF1318 family)
MILPAPYAHFNSATSMTTPGKCLQLVYVLFLCTCFWACARVGNFSATGTVAALERGKDGYTALLKTNKGEQYNAVISRVNLADGKQYQELAVGDKVTLYGDSMQLGETISIKVMKIKSKGAN